MKPISKDEVELPAISKEELLGAIREGVHDAMWRMITNATQMPCADFFASVEDGVAAGIERAAEKKGTFSLTAANGRKRVSGHRVDNASDYELEDDR
jgi:hypothetical protein